MAQGKARNEFVDRVVQQISRRTFPIRPARVASLSVNANEAGALIMSYQMPIAFVPYRGPLADLDVALVNMDRVTVTTARDQRAIRERFERENILTADVGYMGDPTALIKAATDNDLQDQGAMRTVAEGLAAEWRVLKRGEVHGEHPIVRWRARMNARPEAGQRLAVLLDELESKGQLQFPKGWT